MNKKKKDVPLSSRVEEFMASERRLMRKYEERIRQGKDEEKCFLVLATALHNTRLQLGLTWEQLAEKVDGIGDKSGAYRIANRQRGVSEATYDRVTRSLNKLRMASSLPPINFPRFPDPMRYRR